MTGPFHHDFNISNNNKIGGRLIFDFKISQKVELNFSTIYAKLIFDKQYPGDKFHFIIESQYHIQTKKNEKYRKKFPCKSIPSYTQIVPLQANQRFRLISQEDQAPNPTLRLKRKASNLIKMESRSQLQWSRRYRDQMPSLKIKLKSSQLLSCTLNLKVFRFVDIHRFTEFGQLFFTLSEILSNAKTDQSSPLSQLRVAKLEKKLCDDGRTLGNFKIELSVKHNTFITQMTNLAQTEDGIVNLNPLELYKVKTSCQYKQYLFLQKYLYQIIKLKQQKEVSNDIAHISLINHSIAKQLSQMHIQLMKHMRNSYNYHLENRKKILEKKMLLLKLLKMLGSLIKQNNDIELSEICWKNIVCILKRGQMLLKYWEFHNEQIQCIIDSQINKQLQQKIQISLEYERIIFELLKFALDSQILQLAFGEQKQYSEVFKAFCIFRIPLFRNKLMEAISDKLHKQKLTLQKYVKNRDGIFQELTKQQLLSELDWDNKFIKVIILTSKGKQIQKQISQMLENHEWFEIIKSETQYFCNFVKFLVLKYNLFLQIFSNNKESYFPGYSIIIKGFLLAMCQINLENYENYIIFTAMALLQNKKMIIPFLQILYSKTNLYEQNSVLRLIHILSHFVHALTKNNSVLDSFPYSYMMKGLKLIIQSQCSLSLSYALVFIYNNYKRFNDAFKYQLSLYLMGKMFWKLFFNWSFNLRRIFYHIIILRVSQDTQLLSTTDIKQKIQDCCKLIANSQHCTLKSKRINKQKMISNLPLYKTLKNKLKSIIKKSQSVQKRQKFFAFGIDINIDNIPAYDQQIIIPNYNQKSIFAFSQENNQNDGIMINKNEIFLKDSTQTPSIQTLKLKKKCSYLQHKFIFQCFVQSDFNLTKMESSIQPYMEAATKQFKQILKLVDEHYQKYKILPTVDLGFKIQIDEKQIHPINFDYFNFQ